MGSSVMAAPDQFYIPGTLLCDPGNIAVMDPEVNDTMSTCSESLHHSA